MSVDVLLKYRRHPLCCILSIEGQYWIFGRSYHQNLMVVRTKNRPKTRKKIVLMERVLKRGSFSFFTYYSYISIIVLARTRVIICNHRRAGNDFAHGKHPSQFRARLPIHKILSCQIYSLFFVLFVNNMYWTGTRFKC